MLKHKPTSVQWVCVDCYFLHCNGEVSDDVENLDALLSKFEGMEITAGLLAEEHETGCLMLNYPDVPDDYECECAVNSFSWSSCDGCGSNLGGERHALTGWIKMTEEEYVSACVATRKPIDHTSARMIASWWHGGMNSGLYSFSSCGFVSHAALSEVEHEVKTISVAQQDQIPALEALARYFRIRLRKCRSADVYVLGLLNAPECKPHPGRRDEVSNWDAITRF